MSVAGRPPSLTELGRSLLANPNDAVLSARWTRAVVGALPAGEVAVIDHVGSLVGRVPGSKIEAVVVHQLAVGRDRIARHLLSRLARADRTAPIVLLHHNIALHMGATELADRIGREAVERGFVAGGVAATMAARRALAAHRPDAAVAALGDVASDDVAHTMLLLTALRTTGRHDEVLTVLDSTEIASSPSLTRYRYEALLAVGDLDAAHRLAQTLGVDDLGHVSTRTVRMDDATRSTAARTNAVPRLLDDVRTFEERVGPAPAVLAAYAELGAYDDLDRIEATLDPATLAPAAVVLVAETHYRRGHFEAATTLLDRLTGLDDSGDAEALRLRILTETGRSAEAVERQQPRTGTVGAALDDAIRHALLREHRFAEAFRITAPVRQKTITARFGSKAGTGEDPPHVGTRFVVTHSSLTDEIAVAGRYGELAAHSDRLVVTCDPRLASMLRRAYPAITFVPVRRLQARSDSFVRPGAPDRPESTLHEDLTTEAADLAEASDEVVLSPLLQHRAIAAKKRVPASAYLTPDPRLAAEQAARLPAGRTVGLVWRSGPVADLDSLAVTDLAPLLAEPVGERSGEQTTVVCLQDDVTDDERETLRHLTAGRVWFPDSDSDSDSDSDGDDLEARLALVSGLSAVVGVASAVVELAAAAGVPTVLLAASHRVAWRAMDEQGRDFWHESLRVAVSDDLTDREQLVRAATASLAQLRRPRARWRRRAR